MPSLTMAQLLAANEQLVLNMLLIQDQVRAGEKALQELSRTADLDQLTNLPNRREFNARLYKAISNAQQRGETFALLFLDINNFKTINDTLGHRMGDAVLVEAAHRLTQCVQYGNTVARYGGDEFVILLTPCALRGEAVIIADEIIAKLGVARLIGGRQLSISVSVGISFYPEDGADSNALVDSADLAMYKNKIDKRALSNRALRSNGRMVQMREANGKLVIAALGAQLLQKHAEEMLRQEQFVMAKVAHELRNPLTPLSLSAELLSHAKQEAMPHLHGIIGRQIEHLTRLVEDLVDVTRARTGKLHLTREKIDLSIAIIEAIDVCTPAINAKNQTLTLCAPDTALYVEGDSFRMAQIFFNLLGNASKFTAPMGTIKVSIGVMGAWVEISVSDNGIGMSATTLPRIFEPFMQDTQALGFNTRGLGIGLTVVRELVQSHGGSIVAQSKGLGLGSCFTVKVPLITPRH